MNDTWTFSNHPPYVDAKLDTKADRFFPKLGGGGCFTITMESKLMKRTTTVLLALFVVTASLFAAPVSEQQPLRVGIMPDADSLPFLVAEAEQLFADEQVPVELVRFQSPVERDAALQAGKLDGIVGDVLGALFLEQAGFDISITSITNGRYGLAASPKSGITSIRQLSGKPVGVSSNTIIEYIASTMASRSGLASSMPTMLAVPKIPVRMELLLSGQLEAACLPEPLYTLVLTKGAVALGDSVQLGEAPGVMIFTAASVKEKSKQLTGFYKAYWKAAQRINAHNEAYRSFLVDQAQFPAPVKDAFSFVTYTKPALPSEAQIGEVEQWMMERNLLSNSISYAKLVDASVVSLL